MRIFLDSEKIHSHIPLFPAFHAPVAARFRLLRHGLLRPPAWCRFLSLAHVHGNGRERGSPVPHPSADGRAHVCAGVFKPAAWQIYLLRIIPKICHVIGCR